MGIIAPEHVAAQVSQVTVKGRIFDVTQQTPLPGVSILSNSGRGTASDSLGYYSLLLSESDSIWFSYQGKPTPKYAVKGIPYLNSFDISIKVKSSVLPTVTVWKHGYRLDSLRNRQDYAKVFNYSKPGLSTSMMPPGSGNMGVGLDIGELIGMFQFRKNRRMASLQERLLEEEREKYVDYRFSKTFVRQLTELTGDKLAEFMKMYRPEYDFVTEVSQAELGIYIIESFKEFKIGSKVKVQVLQQRIKHYDY